jgi:integrase
VKWVKLSESNVPAVHREADRLRDEATGSLDIPGVYVSGTGTTYKVVFSAVERDSRGHVRRRQRTRNFPRRDTYGPVTLPDFGKREHPTALEAAYAFKLKADAAAKAGKTARSDDVAMADLFAMFLASKPRRPTTESYYRSTYGKHIEPTFGSWYVKAMDVAAVERWHAELEAKPAAKRAALQVLKAMTSYATRRGLMESDPARSLAVTQNNVRALRADEIPTREQVERLASEVGEDYRALVLLLAYGGLRIGEAVALRVDRLDHDRRRITIDASASEVDGALTFGPTKTGAGTRTITAPRFLMDALAEHVERHPTESGLVFSAPDGGPLRPGNFRRRVFGPAAQRAGLGKLSPHDLRHTAASTLAAQGASATEIAARLGHANAAVTQRVYMHLLAARDERLADMQDEAYRSAG